MIDYLKEHSHSTNLDENNANGSSDVETHKQKLSSEERRQISETIDEAFQAFFARAFAPISLNNGNINRSKIQKRSAWHRVGLGIELIQLQLGSSDVLVAPYHHLPKNVIVQALAAVTRLQERRERGYQQNHVDATEEESQLIHPDTAFRLLQRLATGVGVRNSHRSKYFANPKKKKKSGGASTNKPAPLYEVDFNRVLNIYSSRGKMEMAHRVIALQERTPHAPALSPVTYSILVKGYGKLFNNGNDKVAVQMFDRYFHGDVSRAVPNVISFSTLIGAHMKRGTFDGSRAARELYQDMRFQRRILPDKGLVDIIVKGMVETSRTCGVQASDARFAAGVLRDAEKLDWEDGQLDRRKRAIASAMSNHVANAWEEEAELYGLWKNDGSGSGRGSSDTNMFERHGWNKVDSGFRLWGPGKKNSEPTTDDFLESKGWNDMDSGFRVFF
eukprot:jgi/Psemu1/194232/e_gw1.154.80.1